MKKLFITICYFFISNTANSQITTVKLNGGSVVTKLGYGVSVNTNSSLSRDWFILNDQICPLKLNNVGIDALYNESQYSFKPVGEINITEPITAYEIHHVLYDVFGEHIKTLSNFEVADVLVTSNFAKYCSWYASENQVSEYFICVSYVAKVRTNKGIIWKYNPLEITSELKKIRLKYEEGYAPPNNTNDK